MNVDENPSVPAKRKVVGKAKELGAVVGSPSRASIDRVARLID